MASSRTTRIHDVEAVQSPAALPTGASGSGRPARGVRRGGPGSSRRGRSRRARRASLQVGQVGRRVRRRGPRSRRRRSRGPRSVASRRRVRAAPCRGGAPLAEPCAAGAAPDPREDATRRRSDRPFAATSAPRAAPPPARRRVARGRSRAPGGAPSTNAAVCMIATIVTAACERRNGPIASQSRTGVLVGDLGRIERGQDHVHVGERRDGQDHVRDPPARRDREQDRAQREEREAVALVDARRQGEERQREDGSGRRAGSVGPGWRAATHSAADEGRDQQDGPDGDRRHDPEHGHARTALVGRQVDRRRRPTGRCSRGCCPGRSARRPRRCRR